MSTVFDHWRSREVAIARRRIEDSPLAEVDASARRGQRGEVVDVDGVDGYVYVDFGKGAIACTIDEIR